MNVLVTCLIMVATNCTFNNVEQRSVQGVLIEDNIAWLKLDFSANVPCEQQKRISTEQWVPRNLCDTSKLPMRSPASKSQEDIELDVMMAQLE